jgi:phosphoglycerol transferase MdoB-like AlkP superfamily enzyme
LVSSSCGARRERRRALGRLTPLVALAVLAGASAASCRRVAASSSSPGFDLEGSGPRILETSREIAVPLTLTNIGRLAWDPSRVHLSYHWLWIVPRETLSRSRWNMPYHDGIRSALGQTVAPGGRVAIQGRLLAPEWPGLYWLQWDMVDEGVAWFAQNGSRQPRALVLVLPPLAWMAAPIPLCIALLGVLAARRARPPSQAAERTLVPGPADALWCAAALACKPLMVVHDALLEPTPVAYWLIAVAAALPPMLGLLLPRRRTRAWILVGIGVLGSLVVLGDVVYYRFFGDVLSAPALLAAPQTRRVWGSIRALLSPAMIWIVIDLPVAIWLAVRVSKSHAPSPSLALRVRTTGAIAGVLVVAGLALSAPRVLSSTSLDQMFRDRGVVEQLGLFGFHAYDGWNYARSKWLRHDATEGDVRDALSWFVRRTPLRAGPPAPSFGVARGRNLIVVQVESLQEFAVDFRINGQDVMPHLRRWGQDSLRFTNVTDQTNEGRTSDAEFTAMTSLLPLDHGAVAFRYPGNHYVAMPRVLAEHGYSTLSAVAFEPGFWNRQVMHPSYGFEQSLFETDFELTEQIGWGLDDRDFLLQMVPRLEHLGEPFAAWLITLSLHHPFDDFPERHKVLKLGALEGTSFGNYLHTMHFFDAALDGFVGALSSRGLLDTSVVVVFGDHDAGFEPTAALARTIGIPEGRIAWTANDRVPCFIRLPHPAGIEEGLIGTRSTPAGQTDFAPTILSLLGIDPAGLPYIGRNLLGAAGDGPVLRPYGEWIDGHHLFFTRGTALACFDLTGQPVDGEACDRSDREAKRMREISRLVVTADVQSTLRARLGPDGRERN